LVELRRESNRRPLINVGIAMAFGCSIAGEVKPDEVLRLAERCLAAGADIVGIADTVGYAGPRQVGELASAMTKLCGERPYVVHLHDTRGMAIANASAALDAGARVLDGSLGGLGGCPFAPGASGNAVFEDLVFLCESKGLDTGIDLGKLVAVRGILEREMPGERLYGALARAGLPKSARWQQ
jgi:hydroxymethylglutaryl-CoA lyase